MEISQGQNGDDKVIGRYCGNKLPPVIETEKHVMKIKFVSDASVHAKGFKLKYEAKSGEFIQCLNVLFSYLQSRWSRSDHSDLGRNKNLIIYGQSRIFLKFWSNQ